MHQLYNRKLSQKFSASFSKLTEIRNHNTRNTKLLIYFIPRINKNFSKNLLSYRGSIFWGQIDAEFKGIQWLSFKKNYKKFTEFTRLILLEIVSCFSQIISLISRCYVFVLCFAFLCEIVNVFFLVIIRFRIIIHFFV